MPISGTAEIQAFGPFSRRSHTKRGIVPKTAYDLVFR
jgi:hypothetical protein